jgi:hypothetical protein
VRAREEKADRRLDVHHEVTIMEDMKKPTLHLNGTGYDDLFRQYAEANGALRAAATKLAEAMPHGRDYYVQGDDAYAQARAEHEDRIARVRAVMAELEEIMEDLADQRDAA